MKHRIVVIGGGKIFETEEAYRKYQLLVETNATVTEGSKNWKQDLVIEFQQQVIIPEMSNKDNAKYPEWKQDFEEIISRLTGKAILVGYSLGGIFLVKYLSENTVRSTVKALHLIAPPYDAEGTTNTLGDFILPASLEFLKKQVGSISFYFSKDDPVVPFANMRKYQNQLPNENYYVFDNRQHFTNTEFSELVDNIKSDLKR